MNYFDRNGEPAEVEARGLTAGTFQHEVDHLNGVLFLDRADPRSLSTWEQFERHGMAEFLERIRPCA
jgi:peptide deformylase